PLPAGCPERFRTKVLQGRTVKLAEPEVPAEEAEPLSEAGTNRRRSLNRLLFPQPTKQYLEARDQFGDLSILETSDYLYGLTPGEERIIDLEKGVRLFVGLEAIGEADEKGIRTVMVRVNGQVRCVYAKEETI